MTEAPRPKLRAIRRSPLRREEGGRHWTYAEIEQAAGRLATRLLALGLTPGERLLVMAADRGPG